MMIDKDLFGNTIEAENAAAVPRQLERSVSQPGYNEAVNEDCMVVMQRYPDKYFELAVVDPPYGLGVDGVNPIPNKSGDKNHRYDSRKMWDSAIPKKEYFDELKRVSQNQIIWGGNYFLDELGFCKAPIIWDKLNGESMFADGEMAWTSAGLPRNLKIFRHQWCGAFKDSERKEQKIHPTQKPVALYDWIFDRYAKQGYKILDTHLGGGQVESQLTRKDCRSWASK